MTVMDRLGELEQKCLERTWMLSDAWADNPDQLALQLIAAVKALRERCIWNESDVEARSFAPEGAPGTLEATEAEVDKIIAEAAPMLSAHSINPSADQHRQS